MKDQGLPASRVLDDLHEFYLRRHEGEGTLFEVWEKGAARGDSVTPSTYSEGYRSWMKELLRAALSRNDSKSLLSIGAGNAVIEGEMAEEGYDLLAVDVIEQAVELARSRGLRAECADVSTWTPAEPWPVIYADGVLGHLYKARSRSLPILGRRSRPTTRRVTAATSSGRQGWRGSIGCPQPSCGSRRWQRASARSPAARSTTRGRCPGAGRARF